jgi:O-antigen ligase
VWTLITTAPLTSEGLIEWLGHPLADAFGWWPPSISIAPHSTFEGLPYVFSFMAAFALGAMTSAGRESRDWTGRWLASLTILFAMFALNIYFISQAGEGGRLNARILSANAAAALFGTLMVFAAALIVRAGAGRLDGASALLPSRLSWAAGFVRAPVSSAALIFAIACLLLTASRGGVFATAIGLFVFFALLALRRFRPGGGGRGILFAPIIAVVAVAAWLFMRGSGPVVDRLADTARAAEERRLLLEPHWEAFLARPLFGNGLNTYHEINTMAATPENWGALTYAGAAHNIYVQALEEVGLIGVALMTLMLAPPILRALWRALFGSTGVEWAAALFGVSTLLLLHGAVDFELHIPAVAALYAFTLGAFSGSGK